MQRHLLKLALLFLMQCALAFASEGSPLKTSLPDGWKLEYTETNGFDFYKATPKEAGDAVLFFTKGPVSMSSGDIPAALRKMVDDVLNKSKEHKEFTYVSKKYEVVAFAGEQCKGSYVVLKFISNTRTNSFVETSSLFMITINGQIWVGHFQGTTEQWAQALGLLKSIKLVR
jgi:hypothetical protein